MNLLEPDWVLTCESCEEVSHAVIACDHAALCDLCRADPGCRWCRSDNRMKVA